MIAPTDLAPTDADMARRIIAAARSIAPCLDSLIDPARGEAISILKGVAVEGAARGSRSVKSQRIGAAAVEYFNAESWFFADDRAALRALCGAVSAANTPVGSFPSPGVVTGMWPDSTDA